MQRRKIKSRADAESCLAAAMASGQLPTDWARANGVDARSLQSWRSLIAGDPGRSPLRLVELVAPATSPPSYRVRCGAFEVDAPRDFDDAVLGRLLRVVASAC